MPLMDLNLQTIPPSQGGGAHPVGMFDFQITNTHLQENKDKTGAGLVIEFTSPAGRIEKWYNVSNPSPQAVEIANKELSALGHAINIFIVSFPKKPDGSPVMEMAGHSLRGGKGRMEVAYQKGHEPTTEKPSGGYVEVRKVFDVNGNEPGKAPAGQPQAQPQQNAAGWNAQPNPQPQPNGNWSAGPNASQPAQQQPVQQQPNNNPQSSKPSWA